MGPPTVPVKRSITLTRAPSLSSSPIVPVTKSRSGIVQRSSSTFDLAFSSPAATRSSIAMQSSPEPLTSSPNASGFPSARTARDLSPPLPASSQDVCMTDAPTSPLLYPAIPMTPAAPGRTHSFASLSQIPMHHEREENVLLATPSSAAVNTSGLATPYYTPPSTMPHTATGHAAPSSPLPTTVVAPQPPMAIIAAKAAVLDTVRQVPELYQLSTPDLELAVGQIVREPGFLEFVSGRCCACEIVGSNCSVGTSGYDVARAWIRRPMIGQSCGFRSASANVYGHNCGLHVFEIHIAPCMRSENDRTQQF